MYVCDIGSETPLTLGICRISQHLPPRCRFLKAIEPLEAAYVWLCEIQGWHNPYKTGLACLLYFYLAWHGLLLVGVITFVLAWFARGYLRATGQIRGPPAPPPEDNASDGSIRDKIKYLRKVWL